MTQGSPGRRRFALPRLRHHRHRERLKGFGYFRRIGPGLVTGAADDDPSGIGTYSQVGAAFRFGLLWTAWVSLPLAAAVQETAARLGLSSGKGLAALIKERFSRPVLIGAVTLVAVANTFNIGADIGSMAAAVRLLAPIPFEPLVVAIAASLIAVEVFLPYHRYAKVLRWLTLSLGFYIAVLLVVTVDWSVVARKTFAPHLSNDRSFLAALIAVFGTTISPYLFFWQASEEVEEEIEHHETPGLAATHIRAMRADVIAGMASAVGIMFAIMVASAATLGAKGITSIQTADQAAQALRPIAGSFASIVFTLGIVGTGALAVPVLAGSTGYALAEAFGWREGLSKRFSAAPGFYGAIVAATAVGVTMGFIGINPIRSLYWAAILNGIAAPPLILLMLILSNSRRAVGALKGGVVSDVLVAIAFLVMAALPIAYLLR
jgi:NRAMP (natural resistance-associated macrophage protein)-like metal ion transporter